MKIWWKKVLEFFFYQDVISSTKFRAHSSSNIDLNIYSTHRGWRSPLELAAAAKESLRAPSIKILAVWTHVKKFLRIWIELTLQMCFLQCFTSFCFKVCWNKKGESCSILMIFFWKHQINRWKWLYISIFLFQNVQTHVMPRKEYVGNKRGGERSFLLLFLLFTLSFTLILLLIILLIIVLQDQLHYCCTTTAYNGVAY